MSNFINKLFGNDDESSNHSNKTDVKCENGKCYTSSTVCDKHGNTVTTSKRDDHITEGRTVERGGVTIKSTVSSDTTSNVSLANQEKLNDLVLKLSSTHTQVNDYANQKTEKINDEIQREIDQVVGRAQIDQEELLRKTNEHVVIIDTEYRTKLQKLVEEVDANKAKQIGEIEKELNQKQAKILETAKSDIDKLNKKATSLKIDALQEAQVRAKEQGSAITAQVAHLNESSTFHQSTGTTTIKTDVSAGTKGKLNDSISGTRKN